MIQIFLFPAGAAAVTDLLPRTLRGGLRPPGASRQTWLLTPPLMRALLPAPRVTFLRKESHQRFARNLLVPGPPAQGGDPPWIPPASALVVLVAVNKTLKYPREQYTCRATD